MLALTPGDPKGIGPDIALMLAAKGELGDCLVFADRDLMVERAQQLNLPYQLNLHHIDRHDCDAKYMLACLESATNSCLKHECTGLVTGPVNKATINAAGIPFTGHTDWLREKCNRNKVVMVLGNDKIKVALLTTHTPLKNVATFVTEKNIGETVRIIQNEMHAPNILCLGLNPHAGENGYLGDEEMQIIAPAIEQLQGEGIQIDGPVSGDTAFSPANLLRYDVILAMYHDQGLAPLKALYFNDCINITLGLPFLRTSVDHGTAYDLAGTGQANPESLRQAILAQTNFQ